MTKAYHEILPADYFNNLYPKVKNQLTHSENVCISVLYGCGVKTAFNFLYSLLSTDTVFDATTIFDPEIEKTGLVDFVKHFDSLNGTKNKLVIVRFFEQITDKKMVLQKLDSIRRKNPNKLVFLIFTDYTGLILPQNYSAKTSVFFSDIIYINPFTPEDTSKMIATLVDYYGWKIDKTLHRKIYNLSGGIGRLIKYICKGVAESFIPIDNIDKFLRLPQITFELEASVQLLVKLSKEDLINLGLINEKGEIKSKLLTSYFKNYKSDLVHKLYPHLSDTESKILSFIVENEDETLTLDKIADLMHMSDENFSLWAIYKLVSRLKPKVKNNFDIVNLKGRGYYLRKTVYR